MREFIFHFAIGVMLIYAVGVIVVCALAAARPYMGWKLWIYLKLSQFSGWYERNDIGPILWCWFASCLIVSIVEANLP